MGVRMFTFLAYEDAVDEIVVCKSRASVSSVRHTKRASSVIVSCSAMEDNSKQLGLHSFKSEFRSAIWASNIFRLWK